METKKNKKKQLKYDNLEQCLIFDIVLIALKTPEPRIDELVSKEGFLRNTVMLVRIEDTEKDSYLRKIAVKQFPVMTINILLQAFRCMGW